jgi:polar amino acid transport system substrate-binding protein
MINKNNLSFIFSQFLILIGGKEMNRFLLLILIAGLSGYFKIQAEEKKIILATGEWEPYVSIKNPEKGKFTQVVSKIFKAAGFEVEYVYAPWKRVEAMVKNGDAYAGFPYVYTCIFL